MQLLEEQKYISESLKLSGLPVFIYFWLRSAFAAAQALR